ncbi:MAG: hypothetical protein ABH877_04115 [bacterium]
MAAARKEARIFRSARERRTRPVHGAAISIALVFLGAGLLTLATWAGPGTGVVRAAEGLSGQGGGGGQKIAAFEDVTIGPGESWENVIVVGGDLVVQGIIENVAVVIGGDLTIGRQARIGSGVNPDDAAVVSVLGDVVVEPGGVVVGRTVDVADGISDLATTIVADPILRPWHVDSIVAWILSTIFLAVAAVIIAALAPRQLAAVRDRAREHFFSSLGWGALGAIVGVPLATVFLIVTIVGIILLGPWLVVALPVMFLFGLAAVAAMLGRLIVGAREDKRPALMVAVIVGMAVINVARWVPVAGAVMMALIALIGFGATYTAIWAWRRGRRREMLEAAAEQRATWAQATTAPGRPPNGPPTGAAPPVAPPPGLGAEPPADGGSPAGEPPASKPPTGSSP